MRACPIGHGFRAVVSTGIMGLLGTRLDGLCRRLSGGLGYCLDGLLLDRLLGGLPSGCARLGGRSANARDARLLTHDRLESHAPADLCCRCPPGALAGVGATADERGPRSGIASAASVAPRVALSRAVTLDLAGGDGSGLAERAVAREGCRCQQEQEQACRTQEGGCAVRRAFHLAWLRDNHIPGAMDRMTHGRAGATNACAFLNSFQGTSSFYNCSFPFTSSTHFGNTLLDLGAAGTWAEGTAG